jgi:hypothetical protein
VIFYAADYNGRAWRLSSQLEVIELPVRHGDCLTIGAERLVDHLRKRIDVLADGGPPSLNRTTSLTTIPANGPIADPKPASAERSFP